MSSSTWYCSTCGAANDSLNTHCFACAQHHIEDATEIASPDMLLDRYRLLTQVGVGGFGVVYKAIDTQRSDQIVAIKQINLRGLSPQKMIEATDAFNRELRAAMPNTIWTSGCNSWYIGKDGLPHAWPWVPERHRAMLAAPELSDWELQSPPVRA